MPTIKPKAAFIVIGWNNLDILEDCLNSINGQTYSNHQIIYVDNASTDGSVDWVAKHFPRAKIIANQTNTGFARGNNHGIAEALADPEVQYVSLINSDARLDPNWLKYVIEFAELKPRAACLQGTTLDYYNHSIIDSTHIFVARNGQGTQGNWRRWAGPELGPRKIFGVNAAACLISRTFLEAQPFAEVFDETLFMYLEDIDLAARATLMGWDNWLVPSATAYHMGSASAGKRPGFSLYMTFRNNGCMLFKNYPTKLLFKMSLKLLKGDYDTIVTLWRRDQKHAIWLVIKGRLVGFARLPLFIGKRFKMHQSRRLDPDYLWNLMRAGW